MDIIVHSTPDQGGNWVCSTGNIESLPINAPHEKSFNFAELIEPGKNFEIKDLGNSAIYKMGSSALCDICGQSFLIGEYIIKE